MTEGNRNITNGPTKSFMTVGPTLHYSHRNVRWCWVLAMGVFAVACLFWTRIHFGSDALDIPGLLSPASWKLHRLVVRPISIYEYPWQILVLGLLMGIMGVTPVLISQLLSFRYSIPFVLAIAFFARLPLLAVFIAVSCVAAACRPLRFRSRFIAIALCMAPQVVYWTVFGGGEADPIRWGFSYAPWISAWLSGLIIAGIVLGIGHFTRYRPGLVWSVTGVVLSIAVSVFMLRISFAELDYQLYIAGNNPEEVPEFHDHDLRAVIDSASEDPGTRSFLQGLFYPTEPVTLREELKDEIHIQLGYDRWPTWFNVPDKLKYQEKRRELLRQYDHFIDKWPNSKRMPIALYYKALLNEYGPDIGFLVRTEVLRFYSDYAHHENLPIWHKIYEGFPQSPESLEARCRYATHQAGRGQFEKAIELCEVAETMAQEHLVAMRKQSDGSEAFWTAFSPPAQTVMTGPKLKKLLQRIRQLKSIIGEQNRMKSQDSQRRLARFVILNPYRRDYAEKLDELLAGSSPSAPLIDNLLLARATLLTDPQARADRFQEIHRDYSKSDGGIQALYELALVEIAMWKDTRIVAENKEKHLAVGRSILADFLQKHPKSVFADRARDILQGLPAEKRGSSE